MSTNSYATYTRLLNKTEDYIEQHLAEPISLADLAANGYLSPYHFHRLFKKYQQATVHEFVTRFKLERAGIYLLTNPDVSLTEIAFNYGYTDSSVFSRSFKRHFGKSPTDFRKEQDLSSAAHFTLT